MAKIPVALLVEHPENKLFHNLSDEELQELAKDMQENGLIHAVVARTAGEQYQIISGHQRVRAAKLLGWTDIETDVLDVDDNKAARMLISANVKTRT
ncbi:ParB N-terminal domain-containing protein, partial [Sulfoacidibacillus thermotolerans]